MVKVSAARRLTPEEVARKIGEYKKIFNAGSPDDYEVEPHEMKMEEKSAFTEWRDLTEAYQAYEEGGELDYVVEEDLKIDPQTIEKVFTRKRLELIAVIGHAEFTSISHLANHLGRDIKNIYEDLRILKKAGLLRLNKTRRNVQPRLLIDGISLMFR